MQMKKKTTNKWDIDAKIRKWIENKKICKCKIKKTSKIELSKNYWRRKILDYATFILWILSDSAISHNLWTF